MIDPVYYKILISFFKEWSVPMLADFYRFELEYCGPEYQSIEKEYLKGKDENQIVLEFLKNYHDFHVAIDAILGKCELSNKSGDISDDELRSYINSRPLHEYTLLLAFAKGFLIEWLFFYLNIDKYSNQIFSEAEKIADDMLYDKWKKEFRKKNCCRFELMAKYAKHNNYYYYYRLLASHRMVEVVFEWVHSKDINSDFRELIVDLVGKYFTDCQSFYQKYMDYYSSKGYHPLFSQYILPQLQRHNLDKNNAQKYFNRAIEAKLISISDDGNHFKWKGKTAILLSYFCGKIYCYDYVNQGYWMRKEGECDDLPEKDLCSLFESNNIGRLRRKNKSERGKAPKGYEKIDKLFVG